MNSRIASKTPSLDEHRNRRACGDAILNSPSATGDLAPHLRNVNGDRSLSFVSRLFIASIELVAPFEASLSITGSPLTARSNFGPRDGNRSTSIEKQSIDA